MKTKYVILAAAFLGGATYFTTAQTDERASAERYIKDSEAQWAATEVTGDSAVIDRILADDFIGVAPDGSLYKKPQEIADVRKDKGSYISNSTNTINVRFYGDSAVAQGSETWERRTGEPKRGSYVWTDTWVKRNGRWQVVAAEDILVPAVKTK
jgi:ketosteroid isomerase-like protein